MIWEVIGFLLSSFVAAVFLFTKLTGDIFPLGLKRSLNKLVLSNWVKRLPQILPIYNTTSPHSAKDAGILAGDEEWKLEKPWQLSSHDEADEMLVHGVDDNGNCLVAKITRFSNKCTRVVIVLRRNGDTFSVELEGASHNGLEFSLGNFTLELIEPFRAWRLWYNGYMRNLGDTSETNLAHITLNFLWKPLDYAKDFQKNANISLLTQGLTFQDPFGSKFMDMKEMMPKGYYQFGTLHGIAKVNGDNNEESSLYLYGYRTRRHYLGTGSGQNETMVEFFAMRDLNGDALRLISRNGTWIDGEASYASLHSYPTEEVDVEGASFEKDSNIPKVFEVKDRKSTMRVEIWPKYETIIIPNSLDLLLLKMDINGKSAHGIVLRQPRITPPQFSSILTSQTSRKDNDSSNPLTEEEGCDLVSLGSESCCDVSLVGGKGASLAKLAGMSKRFKEFNTARGFCVTANLFRKMIDERRLREVFVKQDTALEQLCSAAIQFIKDSRAEDSLRPLISSHLDTTFGESRPKSLRFAVRSSGLLEDGSDLSCAGQNETFLGVDESSISEKIVQCWASLFTFQSVSYRLNHGQPAVTEMGVVIQEMVDAASAGVLFTADPRTGNPFEMLITANYGLGESVVSASCDPDCIVIGRDHSIQAVKKCEKHNLSIRCKTIGEKKTKVVFSGGKKSVQVENVQEVDSSRLCLSDTSIAELGWIGSKIERELGDLKPVDVEWAFTENGTIFVLQCRPITSLDAWIDFEIIHQFDTAIRTRIDIFTRANTGEVMPLPIHPCSIQSLNRNLDIGVQDRAGRRAGNLIPICSLVSRSVPVFCNTVFISVYSTLYRAIDAEINANVCCIDLTVFGRPVITEEVHKVALERNGAATPLAKLTGLIYAIKLIRSAAQQVEKANADFGNWTFKLKRNAEVTARNIYEEITNDLMVVHSVSDYHCVMSEASSTTLVFAFLSVSEGKKAEHWPPSLYEDVGRLLSAYASVESAEMPSDMDELAEAIVRYCKTGIDDFLQLKSTKESVSWLKSNKSLADAWEKFLTKHGHRSIAELDIGQDSWRTDPTPLITLLKNIVKNKIKNPSQGANNKGVTLGVAQNDEELLNSLSTPLKAGTKMFLKFLLPHCRRMVIYRERTKSLMVKVLEQMKHAYGLLGESMVKEQLIPDKTLIKHLTHHEMGLLIDRHHSTSSILYRALRRMRLYPTLVAMDFPEICVGIPEPLNNSTPLETCDVVKGTPVSAGRIVGTAKVCLSVEDASNQIEKGDILITKGTDIAWSPFFPMLGGVVTELGGLISHGAVVAREYGLPCIVGAINATKIFHSGDKIVLDTSTGTISKVKT